MPTPFTVPDPMLDALATGYGGEAAVRRLFDGQRSRRRLLLTLVSRELPPSAVRDLHDVEAAAPHVIADLMNEPLVGAGTMRIARQLAQHGTDPAALAAAHRYVAALTVVAALRSGLGVRLTIAPSGGWLSLPTLGRFPAAGPVLVEVGGGTALVGGRALTEVPGWQPVRRIRVGAGPDTGPGPGSGGGPTLDVAFDDVEEARQLFHIAAAGHLAALDHRRWERMLGSAWRLVTDRLPDRATELAAELRTLIPLARPEPRAARSGTAHDAVGAIGLDFATSPADCAVTLIHEFQHSKLAALTEMTALHHPSDDARFFAPWREDPRPIGALLQGIYAFLGVADAWRAFAGDPAVHADAARLFAGTRAEIRAAAQSLVGADDLLTPAGQRFAAGLDRAITDLEAVPVPAGLADQADAGIARKRQAWVDRGQRLRARRVLG
ncbi:HEXXH motif-containing putative peptide modification protein [Dactylosporangium siamense]|uniref:HEXXH motif domain-containing protein n=1 Tax=Dactylosporangium siamense TaxID=685454 RepID=A0A919PFX8_9ACTN|nr:HEXXH motif-containing putative peptide modification protein [Dactylosporangium siamense]GIG42647.1 hypothetical protein Dsi01nite_006880 [Dactylosporangium siamense]